MQVKAVVALLCASGCAMSAGTAPALAPAPAAEAGPVAEAEPAPEAATEHAAVPGGRLSRDPRTCDAANDHCLREGTWFVEVRLGKMRRIEPVFEAGGTWRKWSSGDELEGGPAHRTRPATLEDLAVGGQVIFLGTNRVPPSEAEAYSHWRLETIHSIDAGTRTFEFGKTGSGDHSVDLARVIVETRE